MNFSYTEIPYINPVSSERTIIYRPILPLDLSYHTQWFSEIYGAQLYGLIDSGADKNVAPAEVGEMLGIELSGIEPVATKGVEGGAVEVRYAQIAFNINGHIYEAPVGFGETIPFILLGGEGFFDHWKVMLDYPDQFSLLRKQDYH